MMRTVVAHAGSRGGCRGACIRRGERGFSLIEAVVTMVVLAMAVPPALSMLMGAAAARRDSTNTTRATWLAVGALEHVLADAHSADPGLGFEAFDDQQAYLNDPVTGLYARLADLVEHYEPWGFSLGVQVGGLVGHDGTATGDPDRDVYRYITATVQWPAANGGMSSLSVGALVTEL